MIIDHLAAFALLDAMPGEVHRMGTASPCSRTQQARKQQSAVELIGGLVCMYVCCMLHQRKKKAGSYHRNVALRFVASKRQREMFVLRHVCRMVTWTNGTQLEFVNNQPLVEELGLLMRWYWS